MASQSKAITHRLLLDITTRYEEKVLTREEDLALTQKAIAAIPDTNLRTMVKQMVAGAGRADVPDFPFSPTPWGVILLREAIAAVVARRGQVTAEAMGLGDDDDTTIAIEVEDTNGDDDN